MVDIAAKAPPDEIFRVPRSVDILGRLICGAAPLWVALGRMESDLLDASLAGVRIESPVYVTGLARSGTTILLEFLATLDGVATHRYRDFPPVYTPWLWNRLVDRLPRKADAAVERTHLDGIMVTPESPEAFEEVLWMTFFPRAHDPSVSNVLGEDTANLRFEQFYADHIRKLLLVRKGARYVAKGNYNITRMGYIRKIMPGARFVLAVREPAAHIASLMKQHALFREGERRNPRALAHMRRVGHFEFGLDLRPINTGDADTTAGIMALWERGEDVRAWARYWSQVYRFVADTLAADEALREAAMVVRFEDFCRNPVETMDAIAGHCRFSGTDEAVRRFADGVHAPTYYKPTFSDDELAIIQAETAETAARFGY